MLSIGEKYFSRTKFLLGFILFMFCILAIQIVLAFEFFSFYLFYKYNFLFEGEYFVIFISFALSIVTIRYFKYKINSDNWELIKTKEILYSIEKLANNLERVNFVVRYRTPDGIYDKNFQLKQELSSHLEKVLQKKLVQERHEALVYFDPLQKNHLAFQVGLSYFDLLLAPVVACFQLSLIFGTILLVSLNQNLLILKEGLSLVFPAGMSRSSFMIKSIFVLAQNLIGYFILVSICLTVLILAYWIKALNKSGLKGFSNYPMFYDVQREQTYDLIHELKLSHTYCRYCGQLISLSDSFCSFCLTKQQPR